MTGDHAALYRAVCDRPADDLPRLAFADLLDETGDHPRAAFIRTQVELGRVPRYDPAHVKARTADPDALTGWMQAHTLPPAPPALRWGSPLFRRGFPWVVAATRPAALVAAADAPFAAAPIEAVEIDGGGAGVLAGWPQLARVRRLEWSLARLSRDTVARLTASPYVSRLSELSLQYDAVSPDGLQSLTESPLFTRLESLELRRNGVSPALLVDALAAARGGGRLRRLTLGYCGLRSYDAAHLFALPVARGLDELDLGDNPHLGVDGAQALAESDILPSVAVLGLAKTLPGVPGVRALAAGGVLGSVRDLDLSANRLGPVAVRLLAASPGVGGLRALDLSQNPVGDAGAVALAESPHLRGLVSLNLSDAGIGDAGADALARSPAFDRVLWLDLSNNALARPLGAAVRRRLRDRFGRAVRVDGPAD